MKSFLTPTEYKEADKKTQYHYSPEYKGYREKKERSYSECESCGHREFLGWEPRKIPIGEPIRYKKMDRVFPYSMVLAMDRMAESALKDIAKTHSKPKDLGDKITIPRFR